MDTNIILLGAPLTGKTLILESAQDFISEEEPISSHNIGHWINLEKKRKTNLSKELKKRPKGSQIPDELIFELMNKHITNDFNGITLWKDFPYTEAQFEYMKKLLKNNSEIFLIDIPMKDREIIERFEFWNKISRKNGNAESFKNKLQEYKTKAPAIKGMFQDFLDESHIFQFPRMDIINRYANPKYQEIRQLNYQGRKAMREIFQEIKTIQDGS